ncbi:FtsH protease activity modulator HflK [Parvularcula marina]|uniref:FtsH protease activity modulator HflK n=1 Tax=Parvularcula marina TaxID=2292771 RepID=UPI0035199E9B
MPWTDKPGGSGSNGGDGPWGRPEGNNGGQQGGRRPGERQAPDLEELLRSGRERFRRRGGGQGGGAGGPGAGDFQMPPARIFYIGAIVIVLLWLASGFYSVSAGARGVVTTFGSYSSITGPGLNWHMPWPAQSVDVVEVAQNRSVSIGRGQQISMLTSDLNIVDVEMTVDYKVAGDGAIAPGELPNVAKFIYNIEDPEELVEATTESALRQVVGESQFSQVIAENRVFVNSQTQEILQGILNDYDSGIEIIRVNFGKADPPAEVLPAQRDVVDARSQREQLINEATKHANTVVPAARGEARQIILGAEAYGQRVVREAQGAASRFNDIYAEYILAPEVTRKRMYLETMEGVLGRMNKVVIDEEAGGAIPYLNLNEIVRDGQQNRRAPSSNNTTGGL